MQTRIFIVTLIICCFLCGCHRDARPDGLPKLYPCIITVTQSGQPLEGADVRLMQEGVQWIVSGKTDTNGAAKIFTHAKFAGAPEGTFKVLVAKHRVTPSKHGEEPADANSPEWGKWYNLVINELRPLIMLVKPEYDSEKESPHSITITKGKNQLTVDVGEPVEIVVK